MAKNKQTGSLAGTDRFLAGSSERQDRATLNEIAPSPERWEMSSAEEKPQISQSVETQLHFALPESNLVDKHVCCRNTARSARDEGIVSPPGLQGGAGGVEGTPRIPGQVRPLPVRPRTLGQEQAVLLSYLRGFPPPRGPAGAPRSVQRLVLHQSSAVPTPVATRCWGRGGSQAGTVTSSFPLRGECAASNHPSQPKRDNWGLNGGKFKPQLRRGLILVKTHGLLA